MDEIIVCTECSEYTPGDMVYGCVYMKITSPVGANAVIMKVVGYENYTFRTQYEEEGEKYNRVAQDTREHIPLENIQLYSSQNGIRCGNYMFPFKINLPPRIPGSFDFEDDVFRACILYQIVCELDDSGDIQGKKELLIHDTSIIASSSLPKTIDLKGSLFSSTTLTITSSLNKSYYHPGETIRLSVNFCKNGGGKAEVEKINVALVRNFSLTFRNHIHGEVKDGTNFTHTLWKGEITSDSGVKLIKGLSNFMVPLKGEKDMDIPPSTFGSHVICSYCLNVDISVNGTIVELCQSIPYVRKRLKPCQEAEPEWASLCQYDCTQQHKYSISVQDQEHYQQLRTVREVLMGSG